MILHFRCPHTELLFNGHRVPKFVSIQSVALRKLAMLHRAGRLDDLRVPPGNRLESLKGDRTGQHSMRINDQWRVCFEWKDGHALAVEIIDYH